MPTDNVMPSQDANTTTTYQDESMCGGRIDHNDSKQGGTPLADIATAAPQGERVVGEAASGTPVKMIGREVMARGIDGVPEPIDVAIPFDQRGRKIRPASAGRPPTPPTRYLTEPGATKTTRGGRGSEALQAQLVAGLAEGQTHAQIAEATGKSERTVRRWAAKDDIKQRVQSKVDEAEEMRAAAHREAMAFLAKHQLDAATGMVELAATAESETVRLRAQEKILELAGRQVELDLLQHRVQDLEWALEADQDDDES